MSTPKKHHYVPKTYLQSWATDDNIFTCKNDGFCVIRKQKIKSVATKRNLYLLNEKFKDPLVVEKTILPIYEQSWSKVKKAIHNNEPLHTISHELMSFIICQSLRTPKFLEQNLSKISKNSFDIDFSSSEMIATSIVILYPEYIKSSTCHIIKSDEIGINFITTDNPATHWIQDGDIFHHINSIALNKDLRHNSNYKIICPLHPKYCAIVSPNIGIKNPLNVNRLTLSIQPKHTVIQLNKMIKHGSDKMLFFKDVNDLVY